ncbi:antigen 5 like allergen Cul n 1-like [Anopheles nili]|uniref:antigen 5 like allergen Cul n 1-like n=1 Tax=Anopheles nili TaxID=185578 RepID=UPI00237C1A06|nr:antigen 5 like allergen Cul n 1-like [Anopheles nili]
MICCYRLILGVGCIEARVVLLLAVQLLPTIVDGTSVEVTTPWYDVTFGDWETTTETATESTVDADLTTVPWSESTEPSTTADNIQFEDLVEWTDANAYSVYCRPELCLRYNRLGELVPKKHVACGFNGSFAEECPPGRMILRVDTQLRNFILHLHNDARAKLARGEEHGRTKFASAVRMPTVIWDDELANLAEINVRSCRFEHDECRSTYQFLHAGQNLAVGSYYLETDIFEIVNNLTMLWYHEYLETTQEVLDAYTTEYNATIGHYTQMVSDRTTAVGCGIVIYPKKLGGFVFEMVLYACNYAITSIVGQPVYLKGESASRCSTGSNPDYNGLCNVEENQFIKPIPAYV